MRQVPHLNALFAEKGEAGLVIVGVTGEPAEDVEPFLEKNKVQYPIAIAEADDYDVDGIPESFLIDKAGKIVWRGHPAQLDKALVDRTCEGAKAYVAAKGLEDVYALRKKGELGEAWRQAGELLAGGQLSARAEAQAKEWVAETEKRVADAVAWARTPEAAKDLYEQWVRLEPAALRCQGVPGADEAKVLFDKLVADPRTKKEVDAGKRFAEAKAAEAALAFDRAHEIYKDVATKFGTTRAGRLAGAAQRQIEKDGKLGYVADCAYCKAAGAACPTHRKKKR